MNTTLTIKIPKELAAKAKKTAATLGLPITTVVNSMLANFVREQSITLAVHPQVRPEKIAAWNKLGDDMDAHPEKYESYELEEFLTMMDKRWKASDKRAAVKVVR